MCLCHAAVRSGKFTEPPVNGKLYTEADWNKTSTLLEEPYNLSKVGWCHTSYRAFLRAITAHVAKHALVVVQFLLFIIFCMWDQVAGFMCKASCTVLHMHTCGNVMLPYHHSASISY